jgi:Leucine-rich repeat (LRR) protein
MAILAHGSSAEIAGALELLRKGDELELSTRELYDLPAELGAMTGLRALDLSGNHLGKLPPPLLALEGLERLDLGGNKLRAAKRIGTLASLRALELSHNRLSRVPPEVLTLGALEELGLASERYVDVEVRIEGIPDEIRRLQELKRLDLTYAVIESFPEGFFALGLEDLRLFSASLPAEVPEGFARLERLRKLDLRYGTWADAKQVERLAKLLPACEIEH